MATHSNILAWRIPWREEPGRLQSMGSQRVGHDMTSSNRNYLPKAPNISHWGPQHMDLGRETQTFSPQLRIPLK